MHSLLQKTFPNAKAFGVKWLGTYKFNIVLKGELNNTLMITWRTFS
jgi:hypothetical protein